MFRRVSVQVRWAKEKEKCKLECVLTVQSFGRKTSANLKIYCAWTAVSAVLLNTVVWNSARHSLREKSSSRTCFCRCDSSCKACCPEDSKNSAVCKGCFLASFFFSFLFFCLSDLLTGFSCRWFGAAKSEHQVRVHLDHVAARVQGPDQIFRNTDFKDFLNTIFLFTDDEERGTASSCCSQCSALCLFVFLAPSLYLVFRVKS